MEPTASSIVVKTVVAHTVSYVVVGMLAFVLFDYPRLYAETDLRYLMRQTTDPMVMAGPLFQPIRGVLFGVAFVILRRSFFAPNKGWLLMWIALLFLSILGSFGPTPASIEGMIYTTIPLRVQLLGLPEVLLQSFLLSVIVFFWVRNPQAKWFRRTMWSLFVLVLLFPLLGILGAGQKKKPNKAPEPTPTSVTPPANGLKTE